MRSGRVKAMVESRIFCATLAVALRLMPMLEKFVLQETDEVLVDCVRAVGLYSEPRLLFS